MLEVHTWEPNANSGKPLFCLHEKGVPFTYHYVDMGAHEHHGPDFLAINPDGTIPAIVHDGFTMTESTPAMEYIDQAFAGPPLRPRDPFRRWQMRVLLRFMDNVVAPSLAMIASNRLAAPRFAGEDPAELKRKLDRIPLPERRATWEKLMFQATPPADIAESERRACVDAELDRVGLRGTLTLCGRARAREGDERGERENGAERTTGHMRLHATLKGLVPVQHIAASSLEAHRRAGRGP